MDRTVRLALTAGRRATTLARVWVLQEALASSADPAARHYARLLGEALDGAPRTADLDWDAIHDHVADQEDE